MDQTALNKINYGLYVTGVRDTNWFGGCIVDALIQVTLEPATIIYSSMMKNRTTELIIEHGEFTVSVLPNDVHPFVISNFGFQSSRTLDKWKNVPHEMMGDLPILSDISAAYRCKVIDARDLKTHMMFYCEVLETKNADKDSLVYIDYQKSMKPAAAASIMEFRKTGISPMMLQE